jgi:transcription antitermination factor NusG
MDKRDETTWATLELTKAGEAKAIEGKLGAAIRSILGVEENFLVFVPYATYTKGGRTVSVRLIEGYAFVATGLPEVRYFSLEKSPLVSRVFSSNSGGLRVLHTISNAEVNSMKARLAESMSSDMEVGARVRITGGNYRDLEGVVVDLYDDKVAVRIEFRSLTTIVVIPRNLAAFATDDPVSKAASRDNDPISLDELLDSGEPWV